jgi:hypothetical protein
MMLKIKKITIECEGHRIEVKPLPHEEHIRAEVQALIPMDGAEAWQPMGEIVINAKGDVTWYVKNIQYEDSHYAGLSKCLIHDDDGNIISVQCWNCDTWTSPDDRGECLCKNCGNEWNIYEEIGQVP